MIYQHRSITCRRGKLQKRTELFKATALKNFEDAGSPLIGLLKLLPETMLLVSVGNTDNLIVLINGLNKNNMFQENQLVLPLRNRLPN